MSRPKPSVIGAIKENIPHGSKILLAVSGGVDSMVLFHACFKLKRLLKLRLEVAHIDHGLREDSKENAEFVTKYCKDMEVPFYLLKAPKIPPKTNLELWGRKLRYQFFRELVVAQKLDLIATAHNANDVAETLLMRLVSNKDLGSIDSWDPERKLIRPLLSVTRETISKYADKEGIKFWHDYTNDDTDRLRNKVRHVLLPFLETKFDPRIVEVLSNRAHGIAEDIGCLYDLASKSRKAVMENEFGSKLWLGKLRERLRFTPKSLSWRVVELIWLDKLGFKLGREASIRLLDFLLGAEEGIQLPSGIEIRRYKGGLKII